MGIFSKSSIAEYIVTILVLVSSLPGTLSYATYAHRS